MPTAPPTRRVDGNPNAYACGCSRPPRGSLGPAAAPSCTSPATAPGPGCCRPASPASTPSPRPAEDTAPVTATRQQARPVEPAPTRDDTRVLVLPHCKNQPRTPATKPRLPPRDGATKDPGLAAKTAASGPASINGATL